MYRPNFQSTYPPNGPYLQSNPIQRPFQQQQFGPRFQTPPQQFTPPGTYYQSPQHNDLQRHPYQGPVQPQPFYQQPVVQNQIPNQNFETPPSPQYPPQSIGPSFNQMSVPPFRAPVPIYKPDQNYTQPAPTKNFNQPVQSYNNCPPIQNYNQPPPVPNYSQPVKPPCQPVGPNINPYQSSSSGYGMIPNTPYQPQVQNPTTIKQSYQSPAEQCYQQQQPSFNVHRHRFNPRPRFGPFPEQQRFLFNNQNPRNYQPQHGNNRFHLNPRQQYQNHRPRGPPPPPPPPPSFNNKPKSNNNVHQKYQIACKMGDCEFVGHAGAVKEHQNLHHRLGLHKKVLYSNNLDAVKNWIEERKKKWPTKETIQIKSEVENEKIMRGERIADDDFQRFNKKKKFNKSGSKRFNNNKRQRFNAEFIEPVEEPMNGNLKRFAGIDIQNEDIINTDKPVALKLLEAYDQSDDNQSDDEPPEETTIVKKSASLDNKSLIEHSFSLRSTLEIVDKEDNTSPLFKNDNEAVNKEVKIESSSKINEEYPKVNSENGQKRKRTSKKESKPFKKIPPPRTPRTEIVERKGALLEALMGNLMRSERNTITQCICYIRNNMHRFCKIQAA